MAQVLLSVATLALMIFALVDIITSDNWRIRYLPKFAWALLVIFLPLIGSILWLILGKERQAPTVLGSFGDARREKMAPQQYSSTESELACSTGAVVSTLKSRVRVVVLPASSVARTRNV